jgi:hypothetical protein
LVEASAYQSVKLILLELFGLSKDAIHVHIGFLVFALTAVVSRRGFRDWRVVLPGLVLSCLMEILDLRDHYAWSGRWLVWASLHDLMNTNWIPFAVVGLSRIVEKKVL